MIANDEFRKNMNSFAKNKNESIDRLVRKKFKISINSFVIDRQTSFTIQNTNANHFALTIVKFLDRVFMFVQFSLILNFD